MHASNADRGTVLPTIRSIRVQNVPVVAQASSKVSELSPKIFEKAKNLDDAVFVVDFWAPWCGPCKTMAPEFEKAASKLSGKARLAKLNTEQYQTVATKLGIRGIPTLVGYRDGKEVFCKSGAMPAQQIEMLVKTHAK